MHRHAFCPHGAGPPAWKMASLPFALLRAGPTASAEEVGVAVPCPTPHPHPPTRVTAPMASGDCTKPGQSWLWNQNL